MSNRLRNKALAAAFAALASLTAGQALAQVSLTSTATAVTENFDTLALAGASGVLPAGWVLLETGTSGTVNQLYTASTGSANAGDAYSFGAGLLEALSQCLADDAPVLLVAYDTPACGALESVNHSRGLLAVALLLAPAGSSRVAPFVNPTLGTEARQGNSAQASNHLACCVAMDATISAKAS